LRLTSKQRMAATAGAAKYARTPEARKDGGKYILQAVRWLRGRNWETVDEASAPQVSDTPPDGFSFDKDARGRWITLGGNRHTATGWCYGAADYDEEQARHKAAAAEHRLGAKIA
jgi:hypothetical protein